MKIKNEEPFIGLTCDIRVLREKRKSVYELLCDYRYPEAVKLAGGYPILLPIVRRKNVIRKYLDQIDGLVIVGGDDVDPRLYGEERKPGTGTVPAMRLFFERKLYGEARRREIPILGICYGMQLINVLEGGTLFQDIERDAKSRMDHRGKKNPYHRVRINKSSRLRSIVGGKIIVCTDHHQAVCRVAPAFRPVAFSPDGIIEAIESDSEKIMAVQWHPERNLHGPATTRLFRAFVRICSREKRQRK
jgi:putative glutamine amidotransferase